MKSYIIIDSHPWEARVALVENGMVAEIYIERPKDLGVSGNIYKGKVIRVLPGMEAAFVDIGLERAAFLYVTDFYDDFDEFDAFIERNGEMVENESDHKHRVHTDEIEGLIRRGQDVLVQVSREPLGGKGARITSHVSLPGRFLVLLPTMERVGISRRIDDEEERRRLKDIIETIKPPGFGFIVRTAGWDMTEEELRADMEFLLKLWRAIMERKEKASSPSLIHRELDLSLRVVRDLLTQDVDRLLINSVEEQKRLLEFANDFMPQVADKIRIYEGTDPIFEDYGLEVEIERALGKKVWLKSGGYIVIEVTEALTAIDVNTGKYVGKRDLEDTILRTNLEAVKEIAHQLRLRNIGGLVIIDFIDMERVKNRERVYEALDEALKADKRKTNILKISDLGIVEMSRKRTRESLTQVLTDSCSYCDGKGYIKSRRTICYDIFREIDRNGPNRPGEKLVIMVNPDVAAMLYDEEWEVLEYLEQLVEKRIVVRSVASLHVEDYDIHYR